MDFDIRAISLVRAVAPDARVELAKILGSEVEFRRAIRLAVTLPATLSETAATVDPARSFTALFNWARVYRYPVLGGENLHVLASAEAWDGELEFLRVDFHQPSTPRRGLRPVAQLIGCSSMTYERCSAWLVDLAFNRMINPDVLQRFLVLAQPCPVRLARLRLACMCPEVLGTHRLAARLEAIGQMRGAEVIHISPRGYRDAAGRLARALPLEAVLVSRSFFPYVGEETVPAAVSRELIHFCDSDDPVGIEQQVQSWIELAQQQVESQKLEQHPNGNAMLLALMLQGMISHSKIGQFKHCQKTTVLTGVRARRLNVGSAESILDENSEAYEETKGSAMLFLWKEHNDGRRYFLNPRPWRRYID